MAIICELNHTFHYAVEAIEITFNLLFLTKFKTLMNAHVSSPRWQFIYTEVVKT